MDYKYINQLLDRYWQGETTLEEEQILRSFFSQLCVPEELAKFRPLFVYEQTEPKTDRLGDDFDERMLSMVGEPQEARKVLISQRFAPLFKAAAMVAIVLTLSQAAQMSFQSTEDVPAGVPAAYTPRVREGASVAMNDTVKMDTARHNGLSSASTVGQQLEQNAPNLLK